MSNNTSTSTSGGIGFFGLLTLIFITLKLTGFISWSWILVLAPLWIPVALAIVVFGLVIVWALVTGSDLL